MKIDSMLASFFETYDSEAIESIENVGKNIGYAHNKTKIKGYNFNETFDLFNQYLLGYSKYIKEESDAGRKLRSMDDMKSSFKHFMEDNLFKENDMLITLLPESVSAYLSGVKFTIEAYNEASLNLHEADATSEYYEHLNEMIDAFSDKLESIFNPYMENALRISGYTTNKELFGDAKKEKKENPVFL